MIIITNILDYINVEKYQLSLILVSHGEGWRRGVWLGVRGGGRWAWLGEGVSKKYLSEIESVLNEIKRK